MTDSDVLEHLDAKLERNREQRFEGIKHWVRYIESEPPEIWGPQQNAVVNDQLDAAQTAQTTATREQRVKDLAAEIMTVREEATEGSE
jgi:hypothetical protein